MSGPETGRCGPVYDHSLAEEPVALIAHGGICEGGGLRVPQDPVLLYSETSMFCTTPGKDFTCEPPP
jgi:hypothetical protein